MEKIVDHLLEVGGPPGAIVPWHNLRKDLFLKKVRNAGIVYHWQYSIY